MTDETTHSSGSYRIEPLKSNNWLPWKRRITAILRDQKLAKYIKKDAAPPTPADPAKPTADERKAIETWQDGDYRAQTRIELSIADTEMVYIMGATTASQMWKQLALVKENRGKLGILIARKAFYRYDAEEGVNVVAHVSKLREMQEELHLMGTKIEDEEFVNVLVMSLPESWENFLTSYMGTRTDGAKMPTSHEMIAMLLEEERRRMKKAGGSQDVALAVRDSKKKNSSDSDKECYNCKKKGHVAKDCWSKGGGKEGQGPGSKKKGKGRQERANQATESINDSLDVAYISAPIATTLAVPASGGGTWILDSGTTSHISNDRSHFAEYTALTDAWIKGLGKEPIRVVGRGILTMKFDVEGKMVQHRMKDSLYVPDSENCLVSVSRFEEAGGSILYKGGRCTMRTKDDKLVGCGTRKGRLYVLEARAIVEYERANIAKVGNSWNDWHRRYGHISFSRLEIIARKKLVDGFDVDTTTASTSCDACIQAKQTVRPFPQEAEGRSKVPGERIFSDVWGPIRTPSIGGAQYFISFIDDATRMTVVMVMKKKGEATDMIKKFFNEIESRFDRKAKYARFDNGKELVNSEVKKWAGEKGIVIETTAPYSSSQHGTAERKNRSLLEGTRAILIAQNLPPSLWAEAVTHCAYIGNRSPTRALGNRTPFEAWHGSKPHVAHFQEFGRDVWILRQGEKPKPSKLEPKSLKMKFVGFLDAKKAIRFYDPAKRTVRESRNFTFGDEVPTTIATDVPGLRFEGEWDDADDADASPNPEKARIDDQRETAVEVPLEQRERTIEVPLRRTERNVKDRDYRKANNPAARQSTTRQINATQQEAHIAYAYISAMEEQGLTEKDPTSLKEAQDAHDWLDWEKAIAEELDQHEKLKTWELVDLPTGRQAIGNKWVFVRKRDEHGNVIKHKARLVIQGFSQKPGVDYSEQGTFAPVMRFDTLRTLLAIAAVKDWDIVQIDVKGAYLNGKLKEEIFMKQPTGYSDGTSRICHLLRNLYGLKQAGNVWNEDFNQTMEELGYTRLRTDYCAYIKRLDDDLSILIVYVDDANAFAEKKTTNDELIRQIKKRYEITVIGEPKLMLGIHVQRDRKNRAITLSQNRYIRKIIERVGMTDCKPVSTPMDPNIALCKTVDTNEERNKEHTQNEYAARIGELLYAAHATRPDILYAITTLAQFTANPNSEHWTALKQVYCYLKGTEDYKLTYGRDRSTSIEPLRFTDADWGSNEHRKSISGYVFTIAGGAIAWSSKKQGRVALSTAEAEYAAAVHATKQVLWVRNLYEELGLALDTPSILQSDNQAAISISHHPEFHGRTKHIDIDTYFLRDHVSDGTIDIVYVPSASNLADIFTKPLAKPLHTKFTDAIGVLPGQGGVLKNGVSGREDIA